MIELKVAATAVTDPREWKRLMLDAASRGPTAIDEATGMIYVLRHGDIERLLNEPRVHGVGLSLFDAMGIAEGPLRDWYGALMFTNDGTPHDRLRRLVSKAFTPRAVERLRPIAAARVAEQVSALRQAGGGDLVAAFAHLPMHVMCALLGVPAAAATPPSPRIPRGTSATRQWGFRTSDTATSFMAVWLSASVTRSWILPVPVHGGVGGPQECQKETYVSGGGWMVQMMFRGGHDAGIENGAQPS
jgi:hypothetical protein